MDRTPVLSPRAHKWRQKKKKKNKMKIISEGNTNNHKTKNNDNTKNKKRKRKNSKKTKSSSTTLMGIRGSNDKLKNQLKFNKQTQCLQQMFMGDNNYWRQYFEEVLSPANRFPLPPQAPAVGTYSI